MNVDRFELRLESPTHLARIYRSGYILVLLDSCFIIEYSSFIKLLASDDFVKYSNRIPTVCDFTRYEVMKLAPKTGDYAWKNLKKAESLNLCILKTGFIEYGEPSDSLLTFTEYVKSFKKSYSGSRSHSNIEDLALYVTALYLRDYDVKVEVATLDNTLAKSLEDEGLTIHRRPWINIVEFNA